MAAAVEPSSPIDGGSDPRSPRSPRDNDLPLPPLPPNGAPAGEELDSAHRERLQHVLASDIGITTLLSRLKQSISSTRDFASFLRERSTLEEKHAQGLKRLSRSTQESIGRPENRQGSFAHNYREVAKIHDDMSSHGVSFATTLFAMSEELNELAASSERGRKHWKQTGLSAEKRVQDAETAMEKAKAKYNSLAEQYDRARTGEKHSGKFGLKGPKSAAQQEEDLHRKVESADGDYATKVQAAQSQRSDLLNIHRPQTVNALQELIKETDAGVTAQMQKFASLSEKLLLGYGLCITPLKSSSPTPGPSAKSLRDVALSINNERDFVEHVLGFSSKAATRTNEIKYEKHPSLSPKQQQATQHPPSYELPQTDTTPQGYGSGHGRQVSGAAAYQYDGHRGPDPPAHTPPLQQDPSFIPQASPASYQPQGPPPGPSGPPQLPPIESSAGDRFDGQTSGVVSPGGGPGGHYRGVSAPLGAPGQLPPTPSDQMRSPISSVRSQGPVGSPVQPYGQFPGQSEKPTAPQNIYHQPPQPPPGQQPPSEMSGFRPPRGASLGQSNDFPPANGPPHGQPTPMSPQNQPPFLQTGEYRGSAIGAPSWAHGPGPQPGLPPQGVPPNGAPRPAASGGLNALPSRQAGARAGPPLKPVFGVPLDDLFHREGSAVPTVVTQCVLAVDMYGLDVEGIYRTSGSAHHIMQLRQQFDHDAGAVDFRNAAAFYNDIASVTTLLKHFLRDLPDPLLTATAYKDFIQAAKIDEDIVRRDSVHALVNGLPDPNYATLRVVALHLHRVAQHSDRNKMTHSNLAIVFAPTLMRQQGASSTVNADIADAGWQARVVETILNNVFQLFDDDE